MENLKGIGCIFFMVAIYTASAHPILNKEERNIPWAHPCTPNKSLPPLKQKSVLPKFQIASLNEKTENTLMTLSYLLEILKEKYFADSKVLEFLSKSEVKGFPAVKESDEQVAASMYVKHFSQLSTAAVFLENIQCNDDENDVSYLLEDIFRENLQQMCELHLALANNNVELPLPASRSLISPALCKSGSSFERYKKIYKILYQYKLLMENYIFQYKHIMKE